MSKLRDYLIGKRIRTKDLQGTIGEIRHANNKIILFVYDESRGCISIEFNNEYLINIDGTTLKNVKTYLPSGDIILEQIGTTREKQPLIALYKAKEDNVTFLPLNSITELNAESTKTLKDDDWELIIDGIIEGAVNRKGDALLYKDSMTKDEYEHKITTAERLMFLVDVLQNRKEYDHEQGE